MKTQNKPRILTFDLETVGALNSSMGHVQTFGAKWLGEKHIEALDIRSYPEAKPWESWYLLKDLTERFINQADMVVTYFGKGFDMKMVQTPLLTKGVIVAPVPHVDLYFTGKAHTLVGRGSLDAQLTYHKIKEQKFHLDPEVWLKAMHGDPASLDLLLKRVKSDVRATEQLYLLYRPMVRTHPRLTLGDCHNCGSNHTTMQGRKITAAGKIHHRYQCQDCGAWGYIKA